MSTLVQNPPFIVNEEDSFEVAVYEKDTSTSDLYLIDSGSFAKTYSFSVADLITTMDMSTDVASAPVKF